MDFITVLIVAIGLSFDSFAVSLSCGVVQSGITFPAAVRIALVLGLFQGLFPVLGFYLGYFVSDYVSSFDHWIAFGLLGFLGFKMILGSRCTDDKDNTEKKERTLGFTTVITMAVGTSIDALAVGISFAFIYERIWLEALVIGIITFLASMTAIKIGKTAGPRLGSRVEAAGGILLIIIGIKILLEHTLLA